MKHRGSILIALLGVVVLLVIMLLPVTPAPEKSARADGSNTSPTPQENPNPQSNSEADEKVDDALRKLEAGTLPPMRAILTIREVAEAYPQNTKANLTLGALSLRTGQFQNAVMRLQKVLVVDSTQPQAYQLLGRAHLYLGDTTLAREAYQQAVQYADPQSIAEIKDELNKININNN